MSRPYFVRYRAFAAAVGLLVAGCDGFLSGPRTIDGKVVDPKTGEPQNIDPKVTAALCASAPAPAKSLTPARVRRLTAGEFDRSVSQILNQSLTPTVTYNFPVDPAAGGYTNQSDILEVNQAWADALLTAGEALSKSAVLNLPALLPCSNKADDACAQTFIDTFVRGAYRRAVTAEEATGLMAVYRAGKTGADFKAGIELMLQVVFQSPNFVYRTELGEGGPAATDLTSPEIAAELSYLLTGAPPDTALTAATDLATADGREREARRLLNLPQARKQLSSFFAQWLEIDRLDKVSKDPAVFPLFSSALAKSMRQETDAFVEDVVFNGDGKMSSLFSATHSFIDAPLATLYNLPAPSVPMNRVNLDGSQRGGLLTQASVMTALAQRSQHSPVRRGKLVRTRLFCQPISSPPPSLMIVSPEPGTTNTTRERFSGHAAESCQGCHKLMDPIGFGFEHYDGIGIYRPTENGFTINAADELFGTDVDGPFNGAMELSARIGSSGQVRACFTEHWQQFSLGRPIDATEQCSLAGRFGQFWKGETGVVDVMIALVRADEFIHRTAMRE